MQKVMEVYQPTALVLQCGADSLAGDRLALLQPVGARPRRRRADAPHARVQPADARPRRRRVHDPQRRALLDRRDGAWCSASRSPIDLPYNDYKQRRVLRARLRRYERHAERVDGELEHAADVAINSTPSSSGPREPPHAASARPASRWSSCRPNLELPPEPEADPDALRRRTATPRTRAPQHRRRKHYDRRLVPEDLRLMQKVMEMHAPAPSVLDQLPTRRRRRRHFNLSESTPRHSTAL